MVSSYGCRSKTMIFAKIYILNLSIKLIQNAILVQAVAFFMFDVDKSRNPNICILHVTICQIWCNVSVALYLTYDINESRNKKKIKKTKKHVTCHNMSQYEVKRKCCALLWMWDWNLPTISNTDISSASFSKVSLVFS